MKQFLLTNFDPFNKASANQSHLVAEELKLLLMQKGKVKSLVVPTVYDQASDQTIEAMQNLPKQDLIVISLGEGDHRIRFETRAYNQDDCESIADNLGAKRIAQKIEQIDLEYFDMGKALEKFKYSVPQATQVEISDSAGRFVCNNLCYKLSRYCEKNGIPFLFFHVPKHTHRDDVKNPKLVAKNIFQFLTEAGI